MQRLLLPTFVALGFLVIAASGTSAMPAVHMELTAEGGLSASDTRRWFETLTKAGVSGLRISGGRDVPPSIETEGAGASASYRITGKITSAGVLVVPGARFTPQDSAGLKRWLGQLGDHGAEGVTAPRTAFNLTEEQLKQVLADLSKTVDGSTHGKRPSQVVEQIRERLALPLTLDPALSRKLESAEPVTDELDGLSCGTALAAVLRPVGGVLRPHKPAGAGPAYELLLGQSDVECWPVGWPSEKPNREVAPALFEFLTVEIDRIPLARSLDAVQARLKLPLLYDHYALAKLELDAQTPVSFPSSRTFYGKLLDRLLFQAKMKYELRVDEAGQPFLWLTSVKPVDGPGRVGRTKRPGHPSE